MSQYPSPYQAPVPGYYYQQSPVPTFAKRAGLLMFILAPLVILMGGCMALSGTLALSTNPTPEITRMRQQLEQQAHGPIDPFLREMKWKGIVLAVYGIVMVVLAFFVRTGARPAVVTALVQVGLGCLFFLINLGVAISQPMDVNTVSGVCLFVVALGIGGLLMYWLVRAIVEGRVDKQATQQQLAAQYWQHQQAMMAYGGYPPPPGYMPPQGYAPPQGYVPPPGYAPPVPPPAGYAAPPQPYAASVPPPPPPVQPPSDE